jgi:molybdenum cofactor cytidylyltransferase
MRFGRIPVSRADGAILAHAVAAGGTVFKKGRIIGKDDIRHIEAAGICDLVVAMIEHGDVMEDEAATRIARRLAGPEVRVAEAFTGRVNVFARSAGVLTFDREALIALNAIDEGLTVATLAPFARASAGQMVATIKIIPFALPEEIVAEGERLIGERALRVGVHAFTPRAIGLILTRLPQTKASVLRKREQIMRQRVLSLGSTLEEVTTVEHDHDAVTNAIAGMALKGCDPILVFGASAISDLSDVVPLSLLEAGGEIVHLGMPVDPGNLLMLGTGPKGGTVIGVPSCASSPKVNGFDWVLERVCAGLGVGHAEIAAMAPGGLLMEIETRPQPRAGKNEAAGRSEPRIAALVLAAGRSTRMAPRNKLIEQVDGKPVVRHTVEAALAARVCRVIVVTGHEAGLIAGALEGLDVGLVHNPAYAEGLSTSLAKGIEAIGTTCDGALVMLGDMPSVASGDLDRLIAAFSPKEGRSICVPVAGGRRGNPVLWGAGHFPAMMGVKGDTGARHLIGELADEVVEVEVAGDAVHTDVDTPEALASLRTRHGA